VTKAISKDGVVDQTTTTFGIRTLHFDANKGFFLNGKHVELKGTSNHQDHAGVGVALPDALQTFRLKRLKEMGCNAYRSAHNPPTPELLDACDRLGILVLDENRLMGTSPEILDHLKRLILRDRNHPCVFAWSLGNEEWGIEGNEKGAQITPPMQALVQRLDPTRRVTAAISGGWGNGISTVIDVMGYNYLEHGNTDEQHAKYPKQPSMGSEESTTHQTRGIYEDEFPVAHEAPTDLEPGSTGIEKVWKYYMARPYLSGLFLWTGFDYRGEENPFQFPAISAQFGILDLCGFAKDCHHYLKAWWSDQPVLFLSPHWNWKGKEGKGIQVRAFSNCDQVELFLNGKSLGKKAMPLYSRLEWKVPYAPGVLTAKGYKNGKETITTREETTGQPESVVLAADRSKIQADGEDLSVVTVETRDSQGRMIPTAQNEISFSLEGPGRIIGVGNGDPSCHEPDSYFETVSQVKIAGLKMLDRPLPGKSGQESYDVNDSKWPVFFQGRLNDMGDVTNDKPALRVVRGSFDLPRLEEYSEIVLYPKVLVEGQSVYVNGHLVADQMKRGETGKPQVLPKSILRKGRNVYAVTGAELMRRWKYDEINLDPGSIRTVVPAGQWKRSLFSGLAQVIVQSTKKPGQIVLKATSKGLTQGALTIKSQPAVARPSVLAQLGE
jgi:beta-galactosidase